MLLRRRPSRQTRFTSSLFASLLLLLSIAHAEPSAKQMYEQAVSDYKAQHFAQAAQGFERVYALRGTVLLLFNIGQCHRKLGEFPKAREAYERYLSLATDVEDPATVKEARGYVEEIAAYMRTQNVPPVTAARPSPSTAPHSMEPSPTPPPSTTSTPSTTPTVELTAPPPARKRPLYKNPWLWTGVTVGVVAIALGVGLGLGLQPSSPHSTLGTKSPHF
jgi:hypothetical protein